MQVTIVGVPGSGKTTVFNALTGGHAETGSFSGGRAAPNVSVVKVPDERVDRLAALFKPQEDDLRRHHLRGRRHPRRRRARGQRLNPDVLARFAMPTRCCTWPAPSRIRPPRPRPIRGGTWTSWTSSSPSPICR